MRHSSTNTKVKKYVRLVDRPGGVRLFENWVTILRNRRGGGGGRLPTVPGSSSPWVEKEKNSLTSGVNRLGLKGKLSEAAQKGKGDRRNKGRGVRGRPKRKTKKRDQLLKYSLKTLYRREKPWRIK